MILHIKKKWFDMIKSGEKKEEYREIKPYYTAQLCKLWCKNYMNQPYSKDRQADFINWMRYNNPVDFGAIDFVNGYSNTSPSIRATTWLRIGTGRKEWGAEEGIEYYVFIITEVTQ